MSIVKLARPAIQAMQPYEAAIQVDNTVRLNANESPQTQFGTALSTPTESLPGSATAETQPKPCEALRL